MDILKIDKALSGYIPAYKKIKATTNIKTICEIGVRTGGSLELWQFMFPEATIVGVDQDFTCTWPQGTWKVLASQIDYDLPAKLTAITPLYDMIVDDASHIALLTKITWQHLWPLVSSGGVYVIEDWEIGFPGNAHNQQYGNGNVALAKSFLDLFDQPEREGIDYIEYQHGLIIIRKRANED